MTLVDLDIRQSPEVQPKRLVGVPFGEAKVAGNNEIIQTVDNLYESVGLALIDNGKAGFAHFPVQEIFDVFKEEKGREKKVKRTFEELSGLLFSQFGTISQDTEAHVIGGLEGTSENLINKIEKKLEEKKIDRITKKGPHTQAVDWEVNIDQGNVRIRAHRR